MRVLALKAAPLLPANLRCELSSPGLLPPADPGRWVHPAARVPLQRPPGARRTTRSWPRCRCTAVVGGSAGSAPRRRSAGWQARAAVGSWRPSPVISSVETPRSVAARTALRVSTSATASWNPAAISAVAASGWLSTYRATAVLSPEKLNAYGSVGRARHTAREGDGVRITGASQVVEHLAARVAQAQQPRHLVVGLARGVVDRAAQLDDRLAERTHMQQVGMSPGHQQCHALGSGPCSYTSAAKCPPRWFTA